jgi:hypothetical protein
MSTRYSTRLFGTGLILDWLSARESVIVRGDSKRVLIGEPALVSSYLLDQTE